MPGDYKDTSTPNPDIILHLDLMAWKSVPHQGDEGQPLGVTWGPAKELATPVVLQSPSTQESVHWNLIFI